MSSRPTVQPGVLAEISSSAPARLQKKLDKNPEAANEWEWQQSADTCVIAAGGETVTLRGNSVSSVEDVKCSCLLGPRCFHVLACLSVLDIDDSTVGSQLEPKDSAAEIEESVPAPFNQINDSQLRAAENMFQQCSDILAAGLRHRTPVSTPAADS